MSGIGLEAGIVLRILLDSGNRCVCEPEIPYAELSRIEVIEARLLLAVVRKVSARLEQLGVKEVRAKSEKILISKDLRIYIQSRGNREIHLQPLPKALFLLYLRHPEGLAFKELPEHTHELEQIYMKITSRNDVHERICKLLEPGKSALSVNCSRLAASLEQYFEDPVLQDYLIKGAQGEQRQIALDRSFVEWEI